MFHIHVCTLSGLQHKKTTYCGYLYAFGCISQKSTRPYKDSGLPFVFPGLSKAGAPRYSYAPRETGAWINFHRGVKQDVFFCTWSSDFLFTSESPNGRGVAGGRRGDVGINGGRRSLVLPSIDVFLIPGERRPQVPFKHLLPQRPVVKPAPRQMHRTGPGRENLKQREIVSFPWGGIAPEPRSGDQKELQRRGQTIIPTSLVCGPTGIVKSRPGPALSQRICCLGSTSIIGPPDCLPGPQQSPPGEHPRRVREKSSRLQKKKRYSQLHPCRPANRSASYRVAAFVGSCREGELVVVHRNNNTTRY